MNHAKSQLIRAALLALSVVAGSPFSSAELFVKVGGNAGSSSIVPVGDEIWLRADNGAFRVDRKTNQAVRIGGNTGSVYSIVPVGDEIWLGASNGAFRVDRKTNQAVRIGGNTGFVYSIVPVGDEIWLGASNGAFRVDRKTNQAVFLAGTGGQVSSIVPVGDEIWLGRGVGDFRVVRVDRKRTWAVLLGGYMSPESIVPVGGEIWLAAFNGAFRVDRKTNQAVRLGGDDIGVTAIVPVGDEIWLGADDGAYRVDRKKNQAVQLGGNTGSVSSVVPVGDEIWLGADNGAFRVDRKTNQTVPVGGNTSFVSSIVSIGDEIWLGADNGAFRVDRKTNQAVPVGGHIGQVSSIVPVGDEIWLGTDKGAFRVDPKSGLTVELAGSFPLVTRLWGTTIWFEGDTYPIVHLTDRSGEEMYDTSQALPMVMDSPNRAELLEELKDETNWTKATEKSTTIKLRPGPVTLYFAVRDSWGNSIDGRRLIEVHGWVLPNWSLSVLVPILAIALCLLCLFLAPWVRYCHMLLMNPFFRNWVSFGAVPLLLTALPPVRRHIFRRYLRTIAASEKIKLLGSKYIVPEERFSPAKFAETLYLSLVIGIHGQSGIGKSAFLTYLAYECSAVRKGQPFLRRLTPVFIDLSSVGDQKPEEMVQAQLRKFGDLSDEKIAEALIDYGGFLFLFDGLNEMSETEQTAVLRFADLHRNHNWTCISTQIVTDELRQIARLLSVEPLSHEKINELIREEAVDPKTGKKRFEPEVLIRGLTQASYAISRVPFQLELLIEIWVASQKVPQGIDELYSYALGSTLNKDKWIETGHGDYPDILCELAFTLLTERRPFDPKTDYLPDEIKSELGASRLLIDRGEVMEFRHDRIRAYPAARYFALRWRTILGNEQTLVDQNWDAMMEFHLEREQDAVRCREMMLLLAAKDTDSAIRLARWGRANRPELFDGWRDEFSQEIGKRVLSA